MSNNELFERAKNWASNPHVSETDRKEIGELLASNNEAELTERFYRDLEFGTGGMRSILGAGSNRMNEYNIKKASQALANTVLKSHQSDERPKITISYDSRRFSLEFAKTAAGVFAANGIDAYIYENMNPVALLSFATRYKKASAGIMVTASHNPPEYNGYKVFWDDGAQVTPPYDGMIINYFNEINEASQIKFLEFDEGVMKGKIFWMSNEVEDVYFKSLLNYAVNPDLCQKRGKELKVVYTPIHGAGLRSCTRALDELGLTNYLVVEEQAKPDGDFPTVKSPNPENPEALAMAVKLMEKENADIAFGSDPDTDRLGVALKYKGEINYLNGNQIGILMLHYILTNFKEQNRLPENAYFVKTIVTTPLQEKIAKSFGVECENTLTGFKWICGRVNEIEKTEPNRNFIFGTEESFGYLNHGLARDKDGVSSLTLMAEMTLWYKTQGLNLYDALDKIYETYGFSHETLLCLDYEGKAGAEKISRIMENFRNFEGNQFCGVEVSQIEDYKLGTTKNLKAKNEDKITLPSSNVLGFKLLNGDIVYLRPSGTEPKIKFYIMVSENEGDLSSKKAKANEKTEKILEYIKAEAEKA